MADELDPQVDEELEPQTDGAPDDTPEAQPEPEASTFDASEFGDDFRGVNDPVEAARRLHNNLQYERQRAAERDREYAYREAQYRQWEEGQRRQQQEQQTKKEQAPKFWGGPEGFDRRLLSKLRVKDENGKETWAPDASHADRAKAEEYFRALDEFENKWLSDPYGAYQPFVEHVAEQKAQQLIEAKLQEYDDRQRVTQFEQQHKEWLFETKDGRPLIDPRTGDMVLSPWGARFTQYFNEANGQTQAQKIQIAYSRIYPELMAAVERAKAANTTQTDAERKVDFQRRAAKKSADRGGSFPRPEQKRSQNSNKSFEAKLREELAKEGVDDQALARR